MVIETVHVTLNELSEVSVLNSPFSLFLFVHFHLNCNRTSILVLAVVLTSPISVHLSATWSDYSFFSALLLRA